ncbi:hypothetical protein PFJ30894_01924 [Phascolarctobacterium faecium]|nr:hypothetical protein PFJ30894_01924 [Phascolarctobacterium faecium]DAY82977.1 MAG TPA: YtxH-like protein [Caudoviricetes sp.]
MEKIKDYVTSKQFWTGMVIGFALGAMHHYFEL